VKFMRRSATTTPASGVHKPFNMDGKLYYSYSPRQSVRFFFLESTYPVPEQIQWLEKSYRRRTATGRSPSSTIRCIRPESGMGPTCGCGMCWNRSFLK
jgi:hypothetical protein